MVEIPFGDFSAEFDTGWFWRGGFVGLAAQTGTLSDMLWNLSDMIDDEMADDRHMFGAMPLSQAGLIVAEVDIEGPMQLAFDGSMVPYGLGSGLGVEPGGGGVIARFEPAAILEFSLALDLDDGDDTVHAQFAGKATFAGEPVNCEREDDGAPPDAAVPFVNVIVGSLQGGFADPRDAALPTRRTHRNCRNPRWSRTRSAVALPSADTLHGAAAADPRSAQNAPAIASVETSPQNPLPARPSAPPSRRSHRFSIFSIRKPDFGTLLGSFSGLTRKTSNCKQSAFFECMVREMIVSLLYGFRAGLNGELSTQSERSEAVRIASRSNAEQRE